MEFERQARRLTRSRRACTSNGVVTLDLANAKTAELAAEIRANGPFDTDELTRSGRFASAAQGRIHPLGGY
jgi:hypothetical protein